MDLDPDIITEAWRSLRIRTPFDDEYTDADPKSMKELFSTLKELNQLTKLDDPNSVLECSNFSDLNKQHMLRLWHAKADEDLKWGIDVVVANSNIRKSLHPKIWLIVDGQEIEMSLELFAKLRFREHYIGLTAIRKYQSEKLVIPYNVFKWRIREQITKFKLN